MNSCIHEEILFIPEFSQLSMSVGWWMGVIYKNKLDNRKFKFCLLELPLMFEAYQL